MSTFTYSDNIYVQGYYDGACFLYSIANAYTSLTGKRIDEGDWNDALNEIPFLEDFMNSSKGTERYGADLIERTIKNTLKKFGKTPKLKVTLLANSKMEDLAEHLNSKTVILFAIGSKKYGVDHWLCAVSQTSAPFSMRLACSSPHEVKYNNDYSVRQDSLYKKRYYNWELTDFKNFCVQKEAAYIIEKI